jgi:PAS domain S-box-containing protein
MVEALSLEEAHQLIHKLRIRQTDLESQNQRLKRDLEALTAQNLNEPSAEESSLIETDRQQFADRKLSPNKGLLRCIIDAVGDLIYFKDMDGAYRGCNKASERFVGLREEEQIGKTDFDFFSRDQAEAIQDTDRLIATSGHEYCAEEWVLSSDGKKLLLETKKAPFYGLDGNVAGIVGISRDITERKQGEDELRKSQKRFQDIIAQSPLPLVLTDAKGDIEFFNNKFIEVFGYTLDDISTAEQWWIAAYPNDVYRQEVQESWTKAIEKALEKGTQIETQEWEIACKNGAVRCVEFDMMPLGNISVTVMNDITERKKADALIKESNEELDAFVHTVAHDLRNPLTPIIGYAEILRDNYKEQLDEQGLSYLAEIEKAGTRMVALMEDLLSLAASGIIKRPIKFVSTDKVVERVIKNLETNISAAGAILQINPLPPIHIPKTFLAQIFDNLIGNALRYAGNSGDFIEVGGEQAGKQIRFFVRDHGTGISEQERKHIFEIFYRGTNKGEVKGSGIGLAIVYKIARNYGGRAWVEETPGGGCTFWVEVEDAHLP